MDLKVWQLLLILFILWNVITFIMMGIDKARAKKEKWRIPERTLMISSLIFGCIGILGGMLVFHHKTKHAKFYIGVPLTILIDGALVYFLVYYL